MDDDLSFVSKDDGFLSTKEKIEAGISANSKYDPVYCRQIIEYFDIESMTVLKDKEGNVLTNQYGRPAIKPAQFPMLEGFAFDIGVNVDTLHEWRKVHADFSEAYKLAQAKQKQILVQNALEDNYKGQFSMFFAKACLGMRDTGDGDQQEARPLTINYQVSDARVNNA